MSEIEPVRGPLPALSLDSFSLASSMPSMPSRLAVFPRSRFEANFVARLMSSGRLVALSLPSFVAFRFKFGGRLVPFPFIDAAVEGDAVPLEASAPPFSRWPRIWSTLGSTGDPVDDGVPKYGLLVGRLLVFKARGIGDSPVGESKNVASLSYPEYG